MKPQRPILCRFAAMSILVVMAGTFVGLNPATASAQNAEEFSVYHLKDKSPSEARRMLNELLGDEAEDARIVADDDASELLVSGSPAIQKLAAKLVFPVPERPYTNMAITFGRSFTAVMRSEIVITLSFQ